MKYERLTYKPLADNKKKDLDKNGVKTLELSAVYEKLRVENLQGNHDYRSLLYIRLAELEDKIENGTLVELPCKVGYVLYFVVEERNRVYELKVDSITFNENGMTICASGKFIYAGDFGNLIFKTKEEAEAKLKEMKK